MNFSKKEKTKLQHDVMHQTLLQVIMTELKCENIATAKNFKTNWQKYLIFGKNNPK